VQYELGSTQHIVTYLDKKLYLIILGVQLLMWLIKQNGFLHTKKLEWPPRSSRQAALFILANLHSDSVFIRHEAGSKLAFLYSYLDGKVAEHLVMFSVDFAHELTTKLKRLFYHMLLTSYRWNLTTAHCELNYSIYAKALFSLIS